MRGRHTIHHESGWSVTCLINAAIVPGRTIFSVEFTNAVGTQPRISEWMR
eukprot:m.47120 g.47120  ORF g.47120 m.47120 type:complete len:50 (-) comp15559_c0_seq1:600-749(-)